MKKSALIELLGDRPVAYHPMLAKRLGSVKAALFLSQLLYWHGKGRHGDWTWKTFADFYDETGLSRKEQDTARALLRKKGLLDEKRAGPKGVRHFRVNLDALACLLERDIQDSVCPKGANRIVQKGQTQLSKRDKHSSEITSEITPEITEDQDSPAGSDLRLSDSDRQASELWELAQRELEVLLEPATFRTWVRPVKAGPQTNATLTLLVPDEDVRGWLDTRLRSTISRTLDGVAGRPVEFEFRLKGGGARVANFR